jgi:hypothetical protein
LNPYIAIGIIVSTAGILCVSLEKKSSSTEEVADGGNTSNIKPISTDYLHITCGYCLAFTNVLLDSYGSVLTKQYGVDLNTFEINLIRFGFAGVMMALLSLLLTGRDCVLKGCGIRNSFQKIEQNEPEKKIPSIHANAIRRSAKERSEDIHLRAQSAFFLIIGIIQE